MSKLSELKLNISKFLIQKYHFPELNNMRSLTLITTLSSWILVFGLTSCRLVNAQTSSSFQINSPLQDGNGNRFFPDGNSSPDSEPNFEFEGESFEYSPQHNLSLDESQKELIDGKLDQKQLNKFIDSQLPKSSFLKLDTF